MFNIELPQVVDKVVDNFYTVRDSYRTVCSKSSVRLSVRLLGVARYSRSLSRWKAVRRDFHAA